MKRSLAIILIFLLVMGALTGCGPNQEKIQKDFIAILDKPASEESIKEATEYLDKYLSKMDEKYTSDMVLHLEHYILEFNQDGINYKEWAKHYDKYIAASSKELYQIKAKEQKSPMAEDTVLQISWEELVQRTYDIEQFIQKYKDQTLISEDAAWIYGNYMNALVMGTNGTPIFDYKTNAFSEEAKTVYASFINKYPDSATAWALTEYFTYLDSIQYTMDYKDKISSKLFFDTCDWLVSESGKRVFQ
ncbi:MAG TPA: hypothetical protein VM577_20825 [Anaerovoracaceae bacterium]|nr:hypothetical protein [Anaerovoracaceae bacterium]